ncbi:MAG: type II secretion system F family protein [Lachnospiraceae bacterium]|nr:type II secretion system F family protein [Lachnospiraceae bacterium]
MKNVFDQIAGIFAGFSRSQMHLFLCITAIVICSLAGFLSYRFYRKGRQLQEEEFAEKVKESLEDTFRKGRYFNYRKLQKWLKSIGADYAIKGFGDPFKFVMTNLLLAIGIVTLFGLLGSLLAGICVAIAFVATEILMLIVIDQKSNKEMLDDISFLYDATAIQLNSNIYIAKAVTNCLTYIQNERLKYALTELCSNMTLGGDVRTATKDFSEKFHNEYLDTFCNVIVQITAETGEAGKLIEDMSKQLAVLKETTFAERKKATENKLQLCIIGIFIVFTVLIFFLCIASMTGSADILF